ncbi:hypothetical protein ACX8XP_13870 [Calditrichota bacterium LG25]
MPNVYTENAEKWRLLADVDYITQFVKAWIAFNAWYKNNYRDLKTDREAIDAIKSPGNRFRDRLESLLKGSDNESKTVKNEISNLHYQLGRVIIRNRGEQISFENIIIEINSKNQEQFMRNRVSYEVTRAPNNQKLITSRVIDINGNEKLFVEQTNGYNLEELKNNPQYQRLTTAQKNSLDSCYKEVDPKKPISLISRDNRYIEIGSYRFINDVDKICKGIIEILYLLRNSLFHGEIIPNRETNNVYEPAYHILHKLVEEL